jgi:dipeptidyl aminopeptidase/acylaminoacyl peptidase
VIQSAHWGFHRGYLRAGAGHVEEIRFDSPVVSGLSSDARHAAWVWLGQSNSQPNALYYAKRPGAAARTLNTPPLLPGKWPPAVTHSIRWSSEGLTMEGLLYLPADTHGGRSPLIVDVHGGPTGAWQDAFDPLPLFLLGQGWAVLRINPRGSSGYGAAFAAANKDDLGGGDYRDIMAGVDAVIARYPIDADRLALMGYSYGGEMAGFVEGKTDRFKAIVSGAPVIDQESEYGTENGSWYDRWFYGKPWEHAEAAWRQSPLAGVAHAKTPFLLIQGQSDSVDPPGQSQEMYRALRQQGVQVEYIEYPREDHGPLSQGVHGNPSTEPWHGFDARQRLVKFIKAAFESTPSR